MGYWDTDAEGRSFAPRGTAVGVWGDTEADVRSDRQHDREQVRGRRGAEDVRLVIEQYEEEPYYGRHSYEHFIRRALQGMRGVVQDEWRRAPTTAEFKAGVRFSMPRNIGATVQVAEDPGPPSRTTPRRRSSSTSPGPRGCEPGSNLVGALARASSVRERRKPLAPNRGSSNMMTWKKSPNCKSDWTARPR